ncbi:hypothetical protein P1J78_15930, partial [Psychromarinibacter sp. C21-152]|nr:hypothetical protein [Psychromarinibacter sediminicola]
MAREVRKRLSTIARARSFIDWKKRKALLDALDTQRRAILEKVAPDDPGEALDLMWQFMGLANPIFDRTDDSSGTIIGLFGDACEDLGGLADAAAPDGAALADQVFDAIQQNGYGQYDGLIGSLAPVLGEAGLAHLKDRVLVLAETPEERPPEDERVVIGWGSGGPVYADEYQERARRSTVAMALNRLLKKSGWKDVIPVAGAGRRVARRCERRV